MLDSGFMPALTPGTVTESSKVVLCYCH
jgi:hypothetical protein